MKTKFRSVASLAAILSLTTAVSFSAESDETAKEKLPAVVDLRPKFEEWGLQPRRQGSRPTCSVFTVVGALEFAAARQQNRGERFSVEFLNWASNQAIKQQRDGGFFSDMWKGFRRFGICSEAAMPYQEKFDAEMKPAENILEEAKSRREQAFELHWIKRWNVRTGLSDEEFSSIRQTLQQGWPVCAGLRWPKREKWEAGVLQMCPPEAVFDGHSILLVGYRDDAAQPGGGVFIFRNTNGRGRDGMMPYEYAREYMNDAMWIEGKSREPVSSGESTKPAP